MYSVRTCTYNIICTPTFISKLPPPLDTLRLVGTHRYFLDFFCYIFGNMYM